MPDHSVNSFARIIRCGFFLAVHAFIGASLVGAEETSPILKEYRQRVWTTRDELPHNRIQALLQTQDGYLWIGTLAGLARFDGVNFTVFNRSNEPVFVSQDCTALAEDANGVLWIGTATGLLSYQEGKFTRYTREQGLKSDRILNLCACRNGEVWVGTDRGVHRFDHGVFESLEVQFGNQEGNGKILSIFEDRNGEVWVSNLSALHRLHRATGKLVPQHATSQEHKYAKAVAQSLDGRLWFGGAGLYEFHAERWAVHPFDSRLGLAGLRCMLADHAGDLWLGTEQHGLIRFRDGVFSDSGKKEGLSGRDVLCLLEDREGNLWIGTEAGLNCWHSGAFRTMSTGDGLPNEVVWTLNATHDGSVWIGTESGLSQSVKDIFKVFQRPERRRNIIRSLAEDSVGNLWIGTLGAGVDLLCNGEVVHFQLPGGWEDNKIRALCVGNRDELWIGTARGLWRLRGGTSVPITGLEILRTNEIRALQKDRQQRLWVGTFGAGLLRFGLEQLGSSLSRSDVTCFSPTNGLSHNNVWALHEDQEGTLWIATEGGLNRLKRDQLATFTKQQGLPDGSINELVEDDFGDFWLAGNQELWRVSKRELNEVAEGARPLVQCTTYGQADGLSGRDFHGQSSQPSACKSSDGRLWFATSKGVVVIDPSAVRKREIPPMVVIERVQANHVKVIENAGNPNARGQPNERSITMRHRLVAGSGHAIEFHYTACTFVAAEKARFRYRLEGFDKDWIDSGTRRQAVYTNLRPGAYCFRVTASNHNGIWNESGASFAFQIAPFYWETNWFRISASAGSLSLIALVAWGIHLWRLTYVRRIHALETQQILTQERKRIARDLHDEIGSQLARLAMVEGANSFSGTPNRANAGDSTRPAEVARQAMRRLDEVVWATDPERDTLEHLLDYVSRSSRDYLSGTLIALRLDFPDAIPALALNAGVRHGILLVVKEALSNVVQHAKAKEVTMRASVDESHWFLAIQDDGCGFNLEEGLEVGNGLHNMRARVEEAGGCLTVKAQPGRGTYVMVQCPKPRRTGGAPQRL